MSACEKGLQWAKVNGLLSAQMPHRGITSDAISCPASTQMDSSTSRPQIRHFTKSDVELLASSRFSPIFSVQPTLRLDLPRLQLGHPGADGGATLAERPGPGARRRRAGHHPPGGARGRWRVARADWWSGTGGWTGHDRTFG